MKNKDEILIEEIRNRNQNAVKALFFEYFPSLTKFARRFIFDKLESENVVQEFFIHLWENIDNIVIKSSLKAYLYQSVKNRCLNYLRDIHVSDKYNILYIEAMINIDDNIPKTDFEAFNKINLAINALPPKMAVIFKMKYLHDKKYKEIA